MGRDLTYPPILPVLVLVALIYSLHSRVAPCMADELLRFLYFVVFSPDLSTGSLSLCGRAGLMRPRSRAGEGNDRNTAELPGRI